MSKYIQNLYKWGIFLFALASCSSRTIISFRSCPSISNDSPCSYLETFLAKEIWNTSAGFRLTSKSGMGGEYLNLLSLSKNQTDAAMLFYDLIKDKPRYKSLLQKVEPSQKFMLVPFLVVAKAGFPHKSLSKLQGQHWNIGVPEDPLQDEVIQDVLDYFQISYHLVKSQPLNFAPLMEDGDIDFFACLSPVCMEILPKIAKMSGHVQILTVPPIQGVSSILIPVHRIPQATLTNQRVPSYSTFSTLAAKEYLVFQSNISRKKQLLLLSAFESKDILEITSYLKENLAHP